MTRCITVLLVLSSFFCHGQTQNVQYYYAKAKEAYKAKDNAGFYSAIAEAYKLHPYHQSILYYHGLASALNGKDEEAVTFLKKAILINAEFDLSSEDLNSLKGRPDFASVLQLRDELNKPVVNSQRAFTIGDRQLHTEGIAYDAHTKRFFVGSIHKRKIVSIGQDGKVTDFTASGENSMTSVFGLKVDAAKFLWACSSPVPEMENFDSTLQSRVFKFDLATGKLLDAFALQGIQNSVFGDLVPDHGGNIFISDGSNNMVFKVNQVEKKLEKFFESKEFLNIQGIAFSDDDRFLFIADYVKGIFRLEMKTKELLQLTCSLEVSLKGIDGLAYYNNSLVAVQNGVSPLQVMRLFLDPTSEKIIRTEVIDKKHPDFNEPTMGTLVGNTFYYIANSQWGGYENGKIKPADQLQDIVILKAKLN